MGNCASFKDCFNKTVKDRDNDGDVDMDDVLLAGKDALKILVNLSEQLIKFLEILKTSGVEGESVDRAKEVLNIIKSTAHNSGEIAEQIANIKFPKNMPDINGDGKVDIEDYTQWFLQESIHNGYKITGGIRKILEQMENNGVDLGKKSYELSRVEAVLLAADRMKAKVKLEPQPQIDAGNNLEEKEDVTAAPRPTIS